MRNIYVNESSDPISVIALSTTGGTTLKLLYGLLNKHEARKI